MAKRTVQLDEIRIDGDTQFRVEINQDKVDEYAENLANGDEFPLIEVTFDGTNYWLWDGFHRYFAWKKIGSEEVVVNYVPGTQEDAQDLAFSANGKHGYGLTKKDKEKKILIALSKDRHKNKSNKELARLCGVSDKMVAAVRDPKIKAQQAENVKRHFENKIAEENTAIKSRSDAETESPPEPKPSILDGNLPSDDEIMANELAMQADLDEVNRFLESDDKMAGLWEENKKLRFLNSQLEVRNAALMNEKNECIKLCKKLQAQVDKFYKAKK